MKETLQARKQTLVRNAIFDAAIDLFALQGFDETTVEEVAQAAGVSRRSFFRYFASKDDLLARNIVQYCDVLTGAVRACPRQLTPFRAVQAVVLTVLERMIGHSRTRQVLEIAERSPSARQAHTSRMSEVEDAVTLAFAARLQSKSRSDAQARMLAGLTLSIMNVVVTSWFRGEYQNLLEAADRVFALFDQLCSDHSKSRLSDNVVKPKRARVKNLR